MIVVMNTISVKKGHGEAVAQRFQNSKGVDQSPGFVKLEVLLTEGLEEHDEIKVCTTWEDRASFDGWVNGDAFKQAHAQRAGAAPQGESVMLGSKMTIHNVLVAR
ncbi:antibiotic biosynthesis monooxygenase [Paenibacillus sp. GCM10023252]|uniref:antibiotic biosynthesis monooxygenase n=1 Tax=Paenibacillus sp. GCM10023252 TaxID=3252649 RepID=UPI003611DD2A